MKKATKKLLSLVLAVMLIFGAAPFASPCGFNLTEISDSFGLKAQAANSGTCGENLTWTLNPETGELVISGTGAMYDKEGGSDMPEGIFPTSLKTVTIGDSVTTIGDIAFASCRELTNITIPDSVTSIGISAFIDCFELTNITIPESVTSIGSAAFSFSGLTQAAIPASVTNIENHAFAPCFQLEKITVDADNQNYSNDSFGVLFDKNKTVLMQYPAGNKRTDYSVPESVTSIDSCAFLHCESLTKLTIPESVKSIGFRAFSPCENLTDIYYSGTQEQWKEIFIEKSNEDLTDATIHYNSVYVNRSVSISDITLNFKDSAKITTKIDADKDAPYSVAYSSSDTEVATVDKNGNVTATGRGTATITCTVTDEYGNEATDTCTVTVKYAWWQWLIIIFLFGWIWYIS